SSVQFLENAKKYVKTEVSDKAVAELEEVSTKSTSQDSWLDNSRDLDPIHQRSRRLPLKIRMIEHYERIEHAVHEWLAGFYDGAIEIRNFPDFVATKDGEFHGYEVRYVRSFKTFDPNTVRGVAMAGLKKIADGTLHSF